MFSLDEPIGILEFSGFIIFGLALVVAGIYIIIKYIQDTQLALFWASRLLISLGAGFVSFGLLGSLEIEGELAQLTIKAGGPIAFTIAVFFGPPGSWDRSG